MVCAKPSRYFGRLPWLAPWRNQRARSSGSLAGSWAYFALCANTLTVFGLSTPSRCSCNRALGRLSNTARSSFMKASRFLVRCDHRLRIKHLQSTGLAGTVFGEDEGDIVVLFVGAEALDFVDDCCQRGLRTGFTVALQGFDEALFAELLVSGVVGFGDAVGVEGEGVPCMEVAFRNFTIPILENS